MGVTDPRTGRRFPKTKMAEALRRALKTAGVTRTELFESTGTRMRLRAHDLRATFITLALPSGKSEAWISDRTGHQSSQMIRRYQRVARTHQEAQLGSVTKMVVMVPELAVF